MELYLETLGFISNTTTFDSLKSVCFLWSIGVLARVFEWYRVCWHFQIISCASCFLYERQQWYLLFVMNVFRYSSRGRRRSWRRQRLRHFQSQMALVRCCEISQWPFYELDRMICTSLPPTISTNWLVITSPSSWIRIPRHQEVGILLLSVGIFLGIDDTQIVFFITSCIIVAIPDFCPINDLGLVYFQVPVLHNNEHYCWNNTTTVFEVPYARLLMYRPMEKFISLP